MATEYAALYSEPFTRCITERFTSRSHPQKPVVFVKETGLHVARGHIERMGVVGGCVRVLPLRLCFRFALRI